MENIIIEEVWKPIEGFEYYSVSNLGNVFSDYSFKLVKARKDKYGYKRVDLRKNSTSYTHRIHRLIASAFIANPENKPFVDHINGDRSDNRIENLRWATNLENTFNSKIGKNNTSGIKGVCYNKSSKKWIAFIKINGKRNHLGSFENKEDAIKARLKKSIEIQGEFLGQCELIEKKRIELKEELTELERLEQEFQDIIN
jgi:hypothetical protein